MQATQNGNGVVRQLLGPDGLPMPKPEDSFALPHAATFSSITNYASRTYSFRWDEAVKFNIKDALSMRRDAFLMGLLRERQLATAQLNWHLEPDDEKDPIQQATCEGMTKIVKGIPNLQKLLMTLLEAVWYGRYGAQVVWGYKDIAGDKRMTVIKHQPVNGDKILYRFRLTNDGPDIQDGTPAILVHAAEVSKLPQSDTVVTDKARALLLRSEFWRERFIIHHHETEDADYGDNQAAGGLYGIGIRSRIFWLDWLRKEYLSWVSDYLERVGLGITVWYFEAGNPESEKAAFESAKSQSQNFNIVWPRPIGGEKQGAGIERLETNTNGADILLRMQEHIEGIIERYIVGQTLSANAESTGLGSGVADFQAQTKHKIIKFDAQNLEETLTTDLLGPLKKWNFQGITHGVRWVFDIDVPNAKEQLDAAKTIVVDMGIDLDADEVRGIGGFSKPEVGAETTKRQQPANPFGGGDFGKPGAEDQQIGYKDNPDNAKTDDTVSYARFREEEHPRGKPDNAGKFAEKAGAKASATKSDKPAPQTKRAVAATGLKVKPTSGRAFNGNSTSITNQISKQEAGKIGEEAVISWLHSQGLTDAGHMNLDRNNFPIDLIQDHACIEVKTGNVANGPGAQQWRLTIGEPGKKEKEWLSAASEEEKAKHNQKKQSMIHERKKKALADLSKELGKPIKARTITCLINPDTKTIDLYSFDGWHDRIGWKSEQAKNAYAGSITYG